MTLLLLLLVYTLIMYYIFVFMYFYTGFYTRKTQLLLALIPYFGTVRWIFESSVTVSQKFVQTCQRQWKRLK